MKEHLGLTHIYCGNGKGKTTASLGIVLRSIGCKFNIVITQFLKDNDSHELDVLRTFDNVTIISGKGVNGFTKFMKDSDLEKVTNIQNEHLKQAIDLCNSGKCDVLVLDEIIGAVNNKTVDYEMLVDFLKNRPENIEVIMTGRNPKEELIEIADYVSEVNKVKHPFDKGIAAREGVEK